MTSRWLLRAPGTIMQGKIKTGCTMSVYKFLLNKHELRDFTYYPDSITVQDLKQFLESKSADKYTIIRKIVLLDLYDTAPGDLKEKYYEELESLGIMRRRND